MNKYSVFEINIQHYIFPIFISLHYTKYSIGNLLISSSLTVKLPTEAEIFLNFNFPCHLVPSNFLENVLHCSSLLTIPGMKFTLRMCSGGRLNLMKISLAKLTASRFLNLAWALHISDHTVSAIGIHPRLDLLWSRS